MQKKKYNSYNVHGREYEVYEKYRPIRPIGSGAYGEVCAFEDEERGERVAIKKIPDTFQSITTAARTLREIMILRQLDHENVISVKDLIIPPSLSLFKDVYIVYDLMDTDLHQVISSSSSSTSSSSSSSLSSSSPSSSTKLDDRYCRFFLYQLLRALKYLHSGNILHRDLKPSNILVNCNDCLLKLCDFGLARTSSEDEFLTEYVVTRPYRAPELLLGSRLYTSAVDIWSAGCIFVEMMTGQLLFPVRSRQEHPVHHLKLIAEVLGSPEESELAFLPDETARKQIHWFLSGHARQPLSSKFPGIDPEAWDLVERMLHFDPSRRISALDALDHSYLASLHDVTDEPTCESTFNFDCYHPNLTMDNIRDTIWKEAISMNSQEHF